MRTAPSCAPTSSPGCAGPCDASRLGVSPAAVRLAPPSAHLPRLCPSPSRRRRRPVGRHGPAGMQGRSAGLAARILAAPMPSLRRRLGARLGFSSRCAASPASCGFCGCGVPSARPGGLRARPTPAAGLKLGLSAGPESVACKSVPDAPTCRGAKKQRKTVKMQSGKAGRRPRRDGVQATRAKSRLPGLSQINNKNHFSASSRRNW